MKDAGVTKIECPDDSTFVAYTKDQSDRIYQVYMPILPEHVWGKQDYKKIAEDKFDAPLVGTGPYTLAEWKTGQFARFVRNDSYWGKKGFADEVVLRFFPDNQDTMVQALKAGELDYAHNVTADQFKQLQADSAYTAVAGAANGWTQLAFNTYGTGTGKTIEGGGPSTKALLDPAFRDALGYAVNKPELVDRVLGGFGDVGTHHRAAGPLRLARRAGQAAHVRPRRWPTRSSRPPGIRRTPPGSGWTRKASPSA